MVQDRKSKLSPVSSGNAALLVTALFLVGVAGCGRVDSPANSEQSPATLTVGFGLTTGENPQAGIQQTVSIIALEGLIGFARDGRAREWLAESWSTSPDGLTLRVRLRPGVTFHSGKPVTAVAVRDILAKELAPYLGPAFEDLTQIRAASDDEVEFSLKRRSTLLMEGLDVLISEPGSPSVGTGPFLASGTTGDHVEMRANENYYLGKPRIGRILIKPYESIRAAWADMLRGRVDMLYEVGQDALDSLQPSTEVKVFTYQRPYAYVVMLNVDKPSLRDRSFRRALNFAIDRQALVTEVLEGHGTPADGPVWPNHWTYDSNLPSFRYEPQAVDESHRRRITCLFADSSLERLALAVQKQLQAVGVDLQLELMPIDKLYARIQAGDFDAFLADAAYGLNLLRAYRFWHSGGTLNWGHFSSVQVDAALDVIRHAPDDVAYKAGVAAFQRAIVDDPPAIFLAWSERARAVSSRFDVPVEPGRDVLSTLRLWRRVTDEPHASRN